MAYKIFSLDKYDFIISSGNPIPDPFRAYTTMHHSHKTVCECFIALYGEAVFEIEGEKHELIPGEMLVIAPNSNHCISNVSKESLIPCITIGMPPQSEAYELFGKIAPCVKLKTTEFMQSLCRSIHIEQDVKTFLREDILLMKMQLFIAEIIRMIHGASPGPQTQAALQLKEKTEIIDSFFADPKNLCLSANDLADKLHISTRQLNRVLTANYGKNFNTKLISHRIAYASWMLRNTDIPIEHIYEEIGYTSKSAFFKIFKSIVGETPNQYRNSFFKVKKDKEKI